MIIDKILKWHKNCKWKKYGETKPCGCEDLMTVYLGKYGDIENYNSKDNMRIGIDDYPLDNKLESYTKYLNNVKEKRLVNKVKLKCDKCGDERWVDVYDRQVSYVGDEEDE